MRPGTAACAERRGPLRAVAGFPPTVNGYNYSWTVPVSDLGDAIDYIDMQGEGYGPLTNVLG
ncbi:MULTISPECIES: hypothetical protein [unclassified Streptomyces]|uniref:hypothetical protein n=1 Tax=unclassified Streptomyces TaxID=2593676 RepID=UPI002E2DBDF8|nr:hypothetical protein [Streptomyces sp. NBC_00223]